MAAQSKLASMLQFLLLSSKHFLSNKVLTLRRLKQVILFVVVSYILSKLLSRAYRKRYDKVQYVSIKSVLHKKYDFIIVGSGTSGSCVTGILTRGSFTNGQIQPRVLLLEAGAADNYHPLSAEVIPLLVQKSQQTARDWQYETVPQTQPDRLNGMAEHRSKWPRGKICGGTSITNYMVYVKGHPNDYDQWSDEYGCGEHWSYAHLVPYFKELERCLFKCDAAHRGKTGLQTLRKLPANEQNATSQMFVQAAMNCGYAFNDDYNAGNNTGTSYTQYTIDENGRRLTSFRSFVATLFGGAHANAHTNFHLDIVPNAHVSKILCEAVNKVTNKAIGVEINGEHEIFINTNGEVIVSGGTINSPQLLMLSGIGDPQHLNAHNITCIADVPGVGQNLRDHFMQAFNVLYDREKIQRSFPEFDGVIGEDLSPGKEFYNYLKSGKGKFTTSGLDSHVFTQSVVAKKHQWPFNDLQLVQVITSLGHLDDDEESAAHAMKYYGMDASKFNVRDYGPWPLRGSLNAVRLQDSLLAIVMNVRPQSVGDLRLQSNDYKVKPLIDPKYLSHEEDRVAYLDGCRKMKEIYESEPFVSLGCKILAYPDLGNGTFEHLMETALDYDLLTIYHPVGTCKMGDLSKDRMAVCDDRLRVRTFTNLRVCDASVMPNLIGGNTQAPCYVIGVKGAHMIFEDWMERCNRQQQMHGTP